MGIFRLVCEETRKVLSEVLTQMDNALLDSRPPTLRSKGPRTLNLPTLFGDVPIERRLYEDTERTAEEGRYRYLLDEALGIPGHGRPSPMLMELAMQLATEESFRAASGVLETLGVRLSHQSIHKLKNALGRQRREEEEAMREQVEVTNEAPEPSKRLEVLFIEADGVYVPLQRERKRRAEIRAGLLHEGWERIHPSSTEYRLVNKTCYVGIENSETFWEHMVLSAMDRCDLSETPVVLNTDGDESYVSGSERFPKVVAQLDRFHWMREIRRVLRSHPKAMQRIRSAIGEYDAEAMNAVFSELLPSVPKEEAEKIEGLCNYLNRHWEALRPYYERNDPLLKDVTIELRGMGAMEGNNAQLIARRMKHRGASWTIEGADNMARLLALKTSGDLGDWLAEPGRLAAVCDVPEELVEMVRQKTPRQESVGKGYEPKQGRLAPLDGARYNSEIHRFFRRIGTAPDITPWAS